MLITQVQPALAGLGQFSTSTLPLDEQCAPAPPEPTPLDDLRMLQTKMEEGAPEPEIFSRLPIAAPPTLLSGAVLISMATVVPANRRVSLLECWNTRGDLINTWRWFRRTSRCLNTWLPPGKGGEFGSFVRKNPGYISLGC